MTTLEKPGTEKKPLAIPYHEKPKSFHYKKVSCYLKPSILTIY